jgi:putative GTP pyrophosphokinase
MIDDLELPPDLFDQLVEIGKAPDTADALVAVGDVDPHQFSRFLEESGLSDDEAGRELLAAARRRASPSMVPVWAGMPELDRMRVFAHEYAKYVDDVLQPNFSEIRGLFRAWQSPEFWLRTPRRQGQPTPSPLQGFHMRIKRPESVVDKVFRHRDAFPDGLWPPSFHVMEDTIGVRLIVYFLSQLPLIDSQIRTDPRLQVADGTRPAMSLPRDVYDRLSFGREYDDWQRGESGYASLRYVLRLSANHEALEERPWFELQVRTVIEDAWSNIEHVLGYQPQMGTAFPVSKQFRIVNRQLFGLDEHLDFLSQELARFQEEGYYSDADPLNAENLPSVLSELAIECAQHEIDGLLRILRSRGVSSVGVLRELGSRRMVEQIRDVYSDMTGRQPSSFETVANLANVHGVEDVDEQEGRIRAQIAFLDAWDRLHVELSEEWEEQRYETFFSATG